MNHTWNEKEVATAVDQLWLRSNTRKLAPHLESEWKEDAHTASKDSRPWTTIDLQCQVNELRKQVKCPLNIGVSPESFKAAKKSLRITKPETK